MQKRFLKLSAFGFVVAMLALSMTQIGLTKAGAPAQATAAVTAAVAADASTGMVSFGPCPPEGSLATEVAPSSSGAPAGSAGQAAANPSNKSGPRAFVGIQVRAVDGCGAEIVAITPNSPAAQAVLQVGDIIVAVDCVPLTMLTTAASSTSTSSTGAAATADTTSAGGTGASGMGTALTNCDGLTGTGMTNTMATADASGASAGTGVNNSVTMGFANQCLTALGVGGSGSAATQAAGTTTNSDLSVVDLLVCLIQSHQPSDTVLFTVLRNNTEMNIPVLLGATLPAGAATQAAGGNTGGNTGTGGTNATAASTSAATGAATSAPTAAATTEATAAPTTAATVGVPGDATLPATVAAP